MKRKGEVKLQERKLDIDKRGRRKMERRKRDGGLGKIRREVNIQREQEKKR